MKIIYIAVLFVFVQFKMAAQGVHTTYNISEEIDVVRITDNAYVHVSRSEISGYGIVSSNGLIVLDGKDAVLFDTPVNNTQTELLVEWITDSLGADIVLFVPSHWHSDCMGGIDYIHGAGIPSHANQITVDIARYQGLTPPQSEFVGSTWLDLHEISVFCYYPGPAHSMDNIVIWCPSEKLLFGGCMIKDAATFDLGNTADGDVGCWDGSLQKVIEMFYDEAEIVIPGHGKFGGRELLSHTCSVIGCSANNH